VAVLQFVHSTYEVGADMGGWGRRALEPANLPDLERPAGVRLLDLNVRVGRRPPRVRGPLISATIRACSAPPTGP
jgi:hypothetical protein